MKLFSPFAAAELLERDRQTVTRALRSARPDGEERGAPRYKLSTIISAMDRHTRANCSRVDNGAEAAEFAEAYEAMKVLPTLAQRRAAAITAIPLLVDAIKTVRAQGLEIGENPETSGARADMLCQTALEGLAIACEWRNGEAWQHFNTADAGLIR